MVGALWAVRWVLSRGAGQEWRCSIRLWRAVWLGGTLLLGAPHDSHMHCGATPQSDGQTALRDAAYLPHMIKQNQKELRGCIKREEEQERRNCNSKATYIASGRRG